jgi:hypothetical protein
MELVFSWGEVGKSDADKDQQPARRLELEYIAKTQGYASSLEAVADELRRSLTVHTIAEDLSNGPYA